VTGNEKASAPTGVFLSECSTVREDQRKKTMVEKAVPLDQFEHQRCEKDCLIAACATATRLTHEQVAAGFGIAIDFNSGQPDAARIGQGIRTMDVVYPLLELGWVAAPVFTAEHPNVGSGWLKAPPTSDEVKVQLPGRRAVICYHAPDAIGGEHSLAWTGNEAIECSQGVYIDLTDITIREVIFLSPCKRADDAGNTSPDRR
jgi:hypothetical protein